MNFDKFDCKRKKINNEALDASLNIEQKKNMNCIHKYSVGRSENIERRSDQY